MDSENFRLGIDFGTTYSCTAVWKDGGLIIIPNGTGERTTPSVVIFDSPQDIYVGEETLYHLPKKDTVKIYEIKRIIGKKYDQIKSLINYFPYKIIKDQNSDRPKIKIDFGEGQIVKYYYPEEIATLIIKKLIANAESFLNHKIREVLITVPADFTENQKSAVRYSAEQIEGLRVLQVINEPSAAVLAYGFPKKYLQNKFYPFNKYFSLVKNEEENIIHPMEEISHIPEQTFEVKNSLIGENQIVPSNSNLMPCNKQNDELKNSLMSNLDNPEKNLFKVLVVDLGGGTYDVSLVYIQNKKLYETIAYKGKEKLGGSDFDNRLMDYCLDEFCRENNYNKKNIENNYKRMQRLKRACEETKKYLSSKLEDILLIEDFFDSKPLCCKITRSKFENLCKDLFDQLTVPLDEILREKKLNNKDIDEIIFVGGSCKIPKVKEIIQNKFENIPINDQISPDEAVAYGAAIYAESMRRDQEDFWADFNFIDKIGHSYGVEIEDGTVQILIPKGYAYPADAESYFHTVYDYQYDFDIKIYEGEKKYAKDNLLIGEFKLSDIPKKPKGQVIMTVIMKIDDNQTLTVRATVPEGNGVTKELTIQRKDQYPKIKNKMVLNPKENKLNKEEKEIRKAIFEYSADFVNQKTDKDKYDLIKNYNKFIIKYLDFLETNYKDTSSEKYLFLLDKLFKSYTYFFRTSLISFIDMNEKTIIEKIIKSFIEKISKNAPFRIRQLLNHFKKIQNNVFEQRLNIFVYSIEFIYKKALENYNKKERNCILLSKTLFEECFIISNTFIPENEKSKISADLKIKYNNLMEDCDKIIKIISAISIQEIDTLKSEGKLFSNEKKLDIDNLSLLSYNLELAVKKLNAIKNLNENEDALETKCFYLGNIVKIEFLKNQEKMDLKHMEQCILESIDIAMKSKKDIKNKPYFKELLELKKEIEKCNPAPPIMDINKIEAELSDSLDKGNEILIKYILEKYPYPGFKYSENVIDEYKKNPKIFLFGLKKKYNVYANTLADANDPKSFIINKIVAYITKMINKINS